jgi:hypothetical protein
MRIPNEQTISNPKLIDKIISEVNVELMDALAWMYHAYNKSFILTKSIEGREFKYPAFYVDNNEYFPLTPNEDLINFSFFEIGKEYSIKDYKQRSLNEISVPFKLIFWFDYTKVITSVNYRTIEPIKQEILDVFKSLVLSYYGRVKIENITEDFNEIYSSYSLKEIDKQYIMHPFGALAFSGTINFKQSC